MPEPTRREVDRREVEHSIAVSAPPTQIYRMLAEVRNWPRLFPPTIHVEYAEKAEDSERIRIWASANGQPKNWTSRRTLDRDALTIRFRQEVSAPPIASMGGTWIIEPRADGTSLVRLQHDYTAVDDDPAGLDWIERAVDRNSGQELAALRGTLEQAAARDGELLFSFVDTVTVAAPATSVFEFVNEADRWTERLPHVARVRLTEAVPGLQELEMETRSPDGSTHTTCSYRVCFPNHKIVYKQTTLPALLELHTGTWTFDERDGRTEASSQHTVLLRPEAIAGVLGPDADVARAREYVRHALSTNSLATLGRARAHAEGQR